MHILCEIKVGVGLLMSKSCVVCVDQLRYSHDLVSFNFHSGRSLFHFMPKAKKSLSRAQKTSFCP